LKLKADYELDITRLEAEAQRMEERRLAAPRTWRVRRWLQSIVVNGILFVVVLPLVFGEVDETLNPNGYKLWSRLAMVIILAASNIAFADHLAKKTGSDPVKLAAQHKFDYDRFRGVGWISRTVRMGVKMGMLIGLPIGILLVTIPIAQPATVWGRVGVFTMFVGATLAWTIPAAFVIRLLTLRSLKKYMVAKPQGALQH
jgi:hypothetical protein